MIFTFFSISITLLPVYSANASTQNSILLANLISDVFDPFINRRYERQSKTPTKDTAHFHTGIHRTQDFKGQVILGQEAKAGRQGVNTPF